MLPVVLGLLFGTLASVAAGRALEAMLFGVGAVDPTTLLAVGLVLFAVAAVACLLPARRAAGLHPARTLAES
jgi:putative ABC transport system permease protein